MRSFPSQRSTNPVLGAVLLGLFACDGEPGTKASTLPSRPDTLGAAAGRSGSGGAAGASATRVGNGEGGAREIALTPASGGSVAAAGAAAAVAGTDAGVAPQVPLAAFAYVGGGNQIALFSMATDTGVLTPRGAPLQVTPNPSFLAFAPAGDFLFAVNESDNVPGIGSGAVSSFRIDPVTGGLTFINRVSSQGAGPAHVSVDHGGHFVFVANYNGGTIAVLPVADDGTLGASIASASHGGNAQAHEVVIDPSNRFLFVPNKGLSNIMQYRFDEVTGQLEPNAPPAVAFAPGAGTRHLAFHPSAPYAYAINELDDTIVALSFDAAQGTLTPIQTLPTLPAGANGANNTCAEVQVAPSGRFVYGSNRGHDSIVIYAVDAATGRLSLVGHQLTGGNTPRSFHLDRNGRVMLVANQGSNEVVSFQVDATTGLLTETSSVSAQAPAFVGVLYLPLP